MDNENKKWKDEFNQVDIQKKFSRRKRKNTQNQKKKFEDLNKKSKEEKGKIKQKI